MRGRRAEKRDCPRKEREAERTKMHFQIQGFY
jgi:hypothetical protein